METTQAPHPIREETETERWNRLADASLREANYYYEKRIEYEERERKRLRNRLKRIWRSGRKIFSPLLQRI